MGDNSNSNLPNVTRVEMELAGRTLSLETGLIAEQVSERV